MSRKAVHNPFSSITIMLNLLGRQLLTSGTFKMHELVLQELSLFVKRLMTPLRQRFALLSDLHGDQE
jgi:hypothetical protein